MDWLPALDDAFCQRTTTCTLCGQRLTGGEAAWWGVLEVNALSVGVMLCEACRSTDTPLERTMELLTMRYRKEP